MCGTLPGLFLIHSSNKTNPLQLLKWWLVLHLYILTYEAVILKYSAVLQAKVCSSPQPEIETGVMNCGLKGKEGGRERGMEYSNNTGGGGGGNFISYLFRHFLSGLVIVTVCANKSAIVVNND